MRLFTAIDISEEVRETLRRLLARLCPLAHLRWSPVENLHITTKFIGEWPEPRLGELKKALEGLKTPGEIGISIRGLGWFPNARRPRVLWAGVAAPPALTVLAQATSDAVEALGVPAENREYSPHLTLARTRDDTTRSALEALQREIAGLGSDDFGSFRATAQHLYLSAGGKYAKLAEFSLVNS